MTVPVFTPIPLGRLWIVQTSNNIGSLDGATEVYLSEGEASFVQEQFISDQADDRTDWVVVSLETAIETAISNAVDYALDQEG